MRCKLGRFIPISEPFLNRKTCEVATLPIFFKRDQSHFFPGVSDLGSTKWVKMSGFRNLCAGKGSRGCLNLTRISFALRQLFCLGHALGQTGQGGRYDLVFSMRVSGSWLYAIPLHFAYGCSYLTTSALSTTSVVNAGLGFGNRIWSLSEGHVYGHKTNATSAYTIADGG